MDADVVESSEEWDAIKRRVLWFIFRGWRDGSDRVTPW